jgi:hypothetical protein
MEVIHYPQGSEEGEEREREEFYNNFYDIDRIEGSSQYGSKTNVEQLERL